MDQAKLLRSQRDKMIAGVCGGLGEYFDVDSTIFRLAFVVLTLFGGAGLLIYIVLWIVVPESGGQTVTGEDRIQKFGKEVEGYVQKIVKDAKTGIEKQDAKSNKNNKRIVLAVILILIGGMFIVNNYVPHWDIGKLWPLVFVAMGVWFLWKSQPRKDSNDETNDGVKKDAENPES